MRRIGWQLPLTLALGVLAWLALGPVVATIPALYVAAVAPELTRIERAEHRLPTRLVVPGLGVGLLAAAGSWATTGEPPVVPSPDELPAAYAAAYGPGRLHDEFRPEPDERLREAARRYAEAAVDTLRAEVGNLWGF